MSNKGFDPKEVEKVKNECKKKGKSFIFRDSDDLSEDFANFLFVGEYNGKEVIFDAFLYSLEMEFFSNIYDSAIEEVVRLHPKFANADFDSDEGEHIDLMEDIADELAEDEDYQVQEFVDIDEDCDYGVGIDICLNISEITEAQIEKVVKALKAGKLELDPDFYSFELSDDEE